MFGRIGNLRARGLSRRQAAISVSTFPQLQRALQTLIRRTVENTPVGARRIILSRPIKFTETLVIPDGLDGIVLESDPSMVHTKASAVTTFISIESGCEDVELRGLHVKGNDGATDVFLALAATANARLFNCHDNSNNAILDFVKASGSVAVYMRSCEFQGDVDLSGYACSLDAVGNRMQGHVHCGTGSKSILCGNRIDGNLTIAGGSYHAISGNQFAGGTITLTGTTSAAVVGNTQVGSVVAGTSTLYQTATDSDPLNT